MKKGRERASMAYLQRSSTSSDPEHIFNFNVKVVSDQMDVIVHLMVVDALKAVKCLQTLFLEYDTSTDTITHWMTRWVDRRGFDLLQCAIVNNRPLVIEYLLKEANMFPPYHFPKLNPYAHMAATLGFQGCLETVLKYRPDDYFEGSLPCHLVKLPYEILTRLKLGQASGMTNRKLDKIVQSVKGETTEAELVSQNTMAKHQEDYIEAVKCFEDSLTEVIEQPKKFKYKHAGTSLKLPPINHAGAQFKESDKTHSNIPGPKKLKESKVTVFMDVFSDNTLDITEGISILTDSDRKARFLPEVRQHKPTPPDNGRAKISRPAGDYPSQPLHRSGSPRISIASNNANKVLSNLLHKPEIGLRKFKKYKEFIPVFEARPAPPEDPRKYMDKTPLILAAEKNHLDCVYYLLHRFHPKKRGSAMGSSQGALTLASNARIPEAIALILQKNVSAEDYQNAVLLSIRQLYPDSLNVLLTLGQKNRQKTFIADSLLHTLYSQSLQENNRCEMLPEMTRVLISSNENVNFQKFPRKYPMYTLIQSAFNVSVGEDSLSFLKCLKLLLNAKANPNFNETQSRFPTKALTQSGYTSIMPLQRQPFTSAIHCVMASASLAFEHFEVSHWSQILMQKFIELIESEDKTPRKIRFTLLFTYMNYVRKLGLNRRILRALLRYGADPDFVIEGKYALNVYFEEMLPYMTRYKLNRTVHTASDRTVTNLLFLCKAMHPTCLREGVVHFLDNHLLTTPLQALDLTKKFCYYVNQMILSPRSLCHLTSREIWVTCCRNAENVRKLPVSEDIIQLILP